MTINNRTIIHKRNAAVLCPFIIISERHAPTHSWTATNRFKNGLGLFLRAIKAAISIHRSFSPSRRSLRNPFIRLVCYVALCQLTNDRKVAETFICETVVLSNRIISTELCQNTSCIHNILWVFLFGSISNVAVSSRDFNIIPSTILVRA